MVDCELWCSVEDLCCDKAKYSETQIDEAILGASQDLARMSFYQYGICTYEVQPCTAKCSKPCYDKYCDGYTLTPEVIAGQPIQSIVEIASFDADKVKTVIDHEDVWFEYNVLHFPLTFEFPTQTPGPIGGRSTWHIELTAGTPIPIAGKDAAIDLAMYRLKSKCDDDCKPDPRLRSIARQGAEWNLLPAENEILAIPSVAYFVSEYCQRRGWQGARSALKDPTQLVK